jgi:hypothetical protein
MQHGMRRVQNGARDADGNLVPAGDGAAVSDEVGVLGAERIEGSHTGLVVIGPRPAWLAIL